jgi:WD40 repeat protein
MNRSPVAFSPDGKYLATGGRECVRIWNAADGQARHVLPGQAGTAVTSVAYSADGRQLASAEETEQAEGEVQLKVWDTASGVEVRSFRLPAGCGRVMALAFSPDGRRLAAGRETPRATVSSRISVLDAATGAELLTPEGNNFPVTILAFSPDGRRLLAGTKLWDAATGLELLTLGQGLSVGFSPDGGTIAALLGQEVGIWDGRPPQGR